MSTGTCAGCHQADGLVRCSICASIFRDHASLVQHKREVHQPNRLTCPICGGAGFRRLTLIRHLRLEHGHQCPACKKKFGSELQVRKHFTQEKHAGILCSFCVAYFGNGRDRNAHLYQVHLRHFQPYFCQVCSLRLPNRADLDDHAVRVHQCTGNSSPDVAAVPQGDSGGFMGRSPGIASGCQSKATDDVQHLRLYLSPSNDSQLQADASGNSTNAEVEARLHTDECAPADARCSPDKGTEGDWITPPNAVKELRCSNPVKQEGPDSPLFMSIEIKEEVVMRPDGLTPLSDLDCMSGPSREEGEAHSSGRASPPPIDKCNKKFFRCALCQMDFEQPSALTIHLRSMHKSESGYACHHCGSQLASTSQLASHLKLHRGSLFECSQCLAKFNRSSRLLSHVSSQHRFQARSIPGEQRNGPTPPCEKLLRCLTCRLDFDEWMRLKQHVTREHKNICQVCNKVFAKRIDCQLHLMNTHGLWQFQCNACRTGFASSTLLMEHIESLHLNSRSYSCSQCGQTLSSQSGFAKHLVEHLKQRQNRKSLDTRLHLPYRCMACKKAYGCVRDLANHGTGGHKCHKCDVQLKSIAALQRHMARQHEDCCLFQCAVCQAQMGTLAAIEQHLLSHHSLL